MTQEGKKKGALKFDGLRMSPCDHRPVAEFPLVLSVNGVELATLIASPHDLIHLVAGFLRMQGFIRSLDDILALSICPDSGRADVRIRGEVPSSLRPTLTSGCGTGITFNLPLPAARRAEDAGRTWTPGEIYTLMDGLARRAEAYRAHGGIHSSAVGDGSTVLLHAEDVGRHNTLDRIAGEALLKSVDLRGTALATSGRVSSEMAAKAASLGIALIASRTSPTDLAVRICEEHAITLLGYVRGGRFTVYACPEGLRLPEESAPVEGITGIILAGGSSRRMGSEKALLPHPGGRFIEAIHRQMVSLFREVLIVTNTPDLYGFVPCRKVPDLIPGMGALSGIHSGLVHSGTPYIFVVACDMPHLRENLMRHLAGQAAGFDIVVPEGLHGLEPLHAIYGKQALGAIETALRLGKNRVVDFFDTVRIRKVPREEVARFDPEFLSFRNINTPQDYYRFREEGRIPAPDLHGSSPAPRGRSGA